MKTITLQSKNDKLYSSYIVYNKYGIRIHIAYTYLEAIEFIRSYRRISLGHIYRDNISRDSKGMYILGIGKYNHIQLTL